MCGPRRAIADGTPHGADPFGAPNPAEPHALEPITDALYRYTVDAGDTAHSSTVLVTDEGIIVTDPIRTSGALWLRAELRRRFARPVRYVVYSHAHFDHIGGGQVFQEDGAVVVAHRNAVEPIVGERLPTAAPDRVFDDHLTLELGGDRLELTWVAPCHSNSMILLHYPHHRLVQAVDFCPVGAVPYNDFLDFYYDGWIANLEWLQRLDFDVLESGHYALGTKAEVAVNIDYMRDLHDQVLALLRAGQSWDELYRNVRAAPAYAQRKGFATMRLANIAGMYRWVTHHRRGIW